ncbi:hypothetical protein CCYA_CCYA01G0003 [Cyanidiococcus yangmingshanensis]|nr:hypothetical protein CCYA_CCYA01G0003 [Cyanidiococcus yangmingshanensis]
MTGEEGLRKLPLPAAKTLLSLLGHSEPQEATEALAAFVALHTQRLIDASTPQDDWEKLKQDVFNLERCIAEVLLAILQQRLFQASAHSETDPSTVVVTERRNAWHFVSHLVHYASKPGPRRASVRSIRSAVRYELWAELGWVYFAEIAYFLVRWRQRSINLITGEHSACSNQMRARRSALRDAEAKYLMRSLLPAVLRYVPARIWSAVGIGPQANLLDPAHRNEGDASVGTQEALSCCFAAYVAWRYHEQRFERSPLPKRWSGTPTHEWLDDVLLQEQMLVRPWMMPAIAATNDDSAAVEDALLREADRANFETLMLRAMTELRLCREWFVPGPLHGPIEERPPIMKSSAELFPSIAKLQAWKQIFLGCLESRDGTRIPAFLRVDGTAERLLEAIHGRPLSPRESYLVPERLVNVDGTLLHRLNLQPAELLLFHGLHPIQATARIVRHLLDTCTCRLGEYVEALASLPVTVSNLSLIRAVDRKLLFRIYVSRVCSCWQPPLMNPNDFASVRLVELFAIFALRVLDERPQWITGETAIELEAWALAESRIRSAAQLYRCLRARRIGTGSGT